MAYRVVVLVSGSGTLLQALLDAQAQGRLDARVVAVGSENSRCTGLERADWDRRFADEVARHEPDLIVLAGFMKLLGAPFTDRFGDRIINSHPALLPAFPGAHAVRDALAAGATGTGCSIFWVDEGVDTGRMIAQVPVEILPGDDEPTLHERIKVSERTLLVKTVNELAAQHATGPRPAARKVMP